jgi:site-specific DNA recombinase
MNEQKLVRVAIYARVSTEEQAEHGYSIDAQIDTLRSYCQQMGKVIVGEYVDRGLSGKEMTKRHELKRLLRDADDKVFDEVIVWKINRLSRKTRDLLEIVEQLNKDNVYFRSYSENFETETPMGRFALQMMGAVGELERNTIVENVKLGLKQRARMGLHNGGSCLGYRSVELEGSDRKNKKTKLIIVQEEALIVEKIFALYASGKGFRAIANQLNHEGRKTKKDNTFSSNSIREIIINPIYVGIVRYNRFEDWSEKRRRGKTSDPILTQGKHEAIINQELWDKVQVLFQQKSKMSPRVYDSNNLLTGLIRCPQCNSPMVASRTINHLKDGRKVIRRYYSCGQFRSKGSSVCSANSVKADYAEQYVMERIKEVLSHPKVLKDIVAAVNCKRVGGIGPLEQELVAIDNKLKQIIDKKKKILDIYEMDAVDRETLNARLSELAGEENSLQARKSEVTYELGGDVSREVPFDDVEKVLTNLDKLISISSIEQIKTLIHLAIKEIHLKEDRQIGTIQMAFDNKIQSYMADTPSVDHAVGVFFRKRRVIFSI